MKRRYLNMNRNLTHIPFTGLFALALALAVPAAASAQPGAEKEKGRAGEPGVLVVSVVPGSPAAKAGIARGDILLAADGRDVNRADELSSAVKAHKVGESISVRVSHGDSVRNLTLTLAEKDGRPFMGVVPLDPGWSGGFGVEGGFPGMHGQRVLPEKGAVVMRVVSGGPAEKAGLKAGDVIESVDGAAVEPGSELSDMVSRHKVGDTLTLSISQRRGPARDVKVTLEENPGSKGAAYLGVEYASAGARPLGGESAENEWGFPGVTAGVLVRSVADNGPAAKAGVKARDLIVAVQGVPVSSPQAVSRAAQSHKPGDSLALTVFRFADETETTITVTLGEDPKKPGQAYLGLGLRRYVGWEGPEGIFTGPGAPGPREALPPGMPWFRFHRGGPDESAPGI
jgi:S1-C subfamily serine protease